MTAKEVAAKLLESLAPQAELLVKGLIEKHSDALVAKAVDALAKAIPGKLDDVALAAALPKVQAEVKEEALKLADKMSDQV